MWCQHCQQDVPAVGLASSGQRRCGRCLHEWPPTWREEPATAVTEPSTAPHDLTELLNERSLDRMRDLGRRIARTAIPAIRSEIVQLRFDTPHAQSLTQHGTTSTTEGTPATRHRRTGQWLAWLATAAGVVAMATGGGMIARGLITHADLWWHWGVGVAVVGQSLLVLGLLRVLVALWTTSRWAARELQTAQRQLASLQRSTESLQGQREPSAAGFYAALAREASPHLLVANLKGQIDELVSRLRADV